MKRTNISINYFALLLTMFFTTSIICYPYIVLAYEKNTKIPKTFVELEIKIDSLIQKYKIPGIGIAFISMDSIIWLRTIGLANVETVEPLTEKTHFRVGSCTKSFIGLGFLKLVEEGKVDLNTPVREIVPEIEIDNPWWETDPIRIIHLLEHTTGFDDIHLNSLYNKEDPEMPLRQALNAKTSLRKVRWQPGTRYAYSSAGYTLAGYILEKITGQRYEDYLEEVILKPIGMITSTFRLNDESKKLLSVGYDNNYKPIPYFDGYDRPASSLNSSIMEMALFVKFLLNRGRIGDEQIISDSLIDRIGIHTTTIAAKAGQKEGYGFGVAARFQDGFKWYGHSGGGPGFIARYSYLKDYGLGYVVLANKFSITEFGKICRLVQNYLIRNIKPPPKPSIHLSADKLEKFSGYYEYSSSRQQLVEFLDILLGGTTISLENDTLYMQDFMGEKEALIPVSSNTFRKSSEPEASMIFTTTPEDNMIFADIGSYYEKTVRWKSIFYRILFFGALIIMTSSIIYALFWVPVHIYKILKKRKDRSKYVILRVIPLLAILSPIFGILVVANQSIVELGQMTLANVAFFVSTLLFAALSSLSLSFSIISFKKPVKMIERIYTVILSSACFGMTIYLSFWGIIGLRLWAY